MARRAFQSLRPQWHMTADEMAEQAKEDLEKRQARMLTRRNRTSILSNKRVTGDECPGRESPPAGDVPDVPPY